jgi:hypothetical protein
MLLRRMVTSSVTWDPALQTIEMQKVSLLPLRKAGSQRLPRRPLSMIHPMAARALFPAH